MKMTQKMKVPYKGVLIGVISVALLCIISSCATTPDFIAPGFTGAQVDELCVLPVLDHRVDQSRPLKLDKWVLPIVKRQLKKKRYKYSIQQDRSLVERITRDTLDAPTPEWIASLEPQASRYILMLVLEDVSSTLTFGSTANAEMSGYLFDKQSRSLVWRNKELVRTGQGGLIGMAAMAARSLMERSVIKEATTKLFKALPAHR
jgi:hypothetical protein